MIFIRLATGTHWRVFSTNANFNDYTFKSHVYRINDEIYVKETPEFTKAYEQQKLMEHLTGRYQTFR